jgi:hypothetical protein
VPAWICLKIIKKGETDLKVLYILKEESKQRKNRV